MGIWIADPKIGKTTMLLNLGRAATVIAWRKVAHFVFEGSRKQVENRYDASFMDELYNKVRRGNTDAQSYQKAYRSYQHLKNKLYIRGFTDRWDYSVPDIDGVLKDLWRSRGWKPDLVIVDYGDLLTGREKRYRNDQEQQKAAFRDLKSLANKGYALWTASQARRPKEGVEDKAHILKSREIADSYEKVRMADFIGSLNMTPLERQSGIMRLYAELYRDNAADRWMLVKANLGKMFIGPGDNLTSPSVANAHEDPTFGYVPTQMKIPV